MIQLNLANITEQMKKVWTDYTLLPMSISLLDLKHTFVLWIQFEIVIKYT